MKDACGFITVMRNSWRPDDVAIQDSWIKYRRKKGKKRLI